jgi:Acyltransferase
MVSALGLSRAPEALRAGARALFSWASGPLGRTLASFDTRVTELGIDRAAGDALTDLEATWHSRGTAPEKGPLLVVANHPGAYDALVLLAALRRRDVAILAADRIFLRQLPALERHLLFVADPGTPSERVAGVRRALAHLRQGGALLHFGAGEIEPDPAFVDSSAECLSVWRPGTGLLVRGAAHAKGTIVAALVRGVHSPRAKRLFLTRWAERRGLTTLAPLLQVALPAYHDVDASVRFSEALDTQLLIRGAADDAEIAARVRSAALGLVARD